MNRVVETIGYDEGMVKSSEELARQLAVRASSGSFTERAQVVGAASYMKVKEARALIETLLKE